MVASSSSREKSISIHSLFVWLLAVLFFFYEFFIRVLPATLSSNIVDGLNINIEQFAIIGSAYYLTYAIMQIPVGILLDRFSIRLLVTIASALCTIGVFWFTFAQDFISGFIARFLIGIGSSFGFVGLMVITLNWFPKKHFALMLGCGQLAGALGPVAAGVPVALLLNAFDGNWRLIFLGTALIGIVITVLIALFFKGKQKDPDAIVFIDRTTALSKQSTQLLKKPQIWWIMFYSAFIYISLPLLGAFWGTAFMETKGFERPTAAFIVSMVWVGLAIGSPLIGKVSEKIKRRVVLFIICSCIGIISSLLLLYAQLDNKIFLGFLFFLIGLAGAGHSLTYVIITENAPKKLRATALGMNNTAIMGSASVIPPIVTSIIQHYNTGEVITLQAFEKGLAVMPICFTITLLISLFAIKETYCREQNTMHIINK